MASNDAETAKRFMVSLKTASGGFSEAVAVSQRAINNNLESLLTIYPDFRTIDINNPMGTMCAQLDTVWVTLHITDGNQGMVDYCCTFKSGTLVVWEGGNS